MASACIRNMTLSQKNMIQQNCVIISTSQNYSPVQQHQQSSTTTSTANKMPALAPAPPTQNNNNRNTNSILGMNSINMQIQQNQPIDSSSAAIRAYKKKYTYANMPYGEQPPSVARRNARERNRVKQVNNGFANLRQHIPQTIITTLTNGGRGASKKLSKVDTLRMAVEYINRLQELITDTDSETSSNYNSISNSSIIGSPNGLHQYFPSSPSDDTQQHHNNFVMQSTSSSYSSEASVSPAPSCSSELSIGSNHHYGAFNGSAIQQHQQQQHQQLQHQPQQQQFKYEPYDNYNSITDTTPEDEELLDYISSWQEQ